MSSVALMKNKYQARGWAWLFSLFFCQSKKNIQDSFNFLIFTWFLKIIIIFYLNFNIFLIIMHLK
jgi:hypothetical protein